MKETMPGAIKAHSLTVENRMNTVITGVEAVDLFNEQTIVLTTTEGAITLSGTGLNVESLDLTQGRLIVTGRIEAVEYEDRQQKTRGVLSRIFR